MVTLVTPSAGHLCIPFCLQLNDILANMTIFLNPSKQSYKRFGSCKAPKYISWSKENRSQLVRVPAAVGEYRRIELRSPDPGANPYLAFTLLIYAGLNGISNKLTPPAPADINLFTANQSTLEKFRCLPRNINEAVEAAAKSSFIFTRTYSVCRLSAHGAREKTLE